MCVLLEEPFAAFKFTNWIALVGEVNTCVDQQMTYWLANLGNGELSEWLEMQYK